VPGGTEPIVLHRDAVSGGGYMMVGTVISADMDLDRPVAAEHRRQVRRGRHGNRPRGPPRTRRHSAEKIREHLA
jgi:hypothetical protein